MLLAELAVLQISLAANGSLPGVPVGFDIARELLLYEVLTLVISRGPRTNTTSCQKPSLMRNVHLERVLFEIGIVVVSSLDVA